MKDKITLEQILQAVCDQHKIRQEDLTSGGKQRHLAEARAIAALLVRETEHLTLMVLSKELNRDLSGLSQTASRLEARLIKDRDLAEKINIIMVLIS